MVDKYTISLSEKMEYLYILLSECKMLFSHKPKLNTMKKAIIYLTVSLTASLPLNILYGQKSWRASDEIVKKLSASQPEFNYNEDRVPQYVLPSLLTMNDGSPVRSASEWNGIRRDEVLELFSSGVFGRVPGTKYSKAFNMQNIDKSALAGQATMKQVAITISNGDKSLTINLVLFTPNGRGRKAPVFLLINNRGPEVADPARTRKSEFWPVEEAIARGYGMAVFNNEDVDPDNYDEFRNGIHALLDSQPRNDESWGTLAAWAWGASRCLDYLVTDPDVDPGRIAVVGHSRGGKTALWAGAQDKRFAMVVSNESGCGGAALARRRYGETVKRINSAFPHWFCKNYAGYGGKEDSMPMDMHMLLALIAPRLLYVACADEDLWGDPRGSYLALRNALPVFSLLGDKSELPGEVPPLNTQVRSGKVAFHIRNGGHNLLLKDWNWFMDFADAGLK